MRRHYGGCFHIETGLGINLIDIEKPSQISIQEGQILPPLSPSFPLPPTSSQLCFLLLFLVLLLFLGIFKDRVSLCTPGWP